MNQTRQQAQLLQRWPQRQQPLSQFFYAYSITVAAVAANSSGSGNVQINTDAPFMLQHLTAVATQAGAVVANIAATVQITDNGSNQNLFDQPQFLGNVFGTAQLPFILPFARIFTGGSSVQLTVNNLTATATTYYFTFAGQKLYEAG